MPCSRSRRTLPAVLFVIFAIPAVLGGGCRSGDGSTSRVDAASRERLEALPADANVLAACRLASPTDTLPSFDETVRVVGLTPRAVLVQIPRSELAGLAPTFNRISVWGGDNAAGRLDPRLRARLLAAWANDDEHALELIATFDKNTLEGLRERLTEAGATVRTVAGPVATLEANPETIFRLLALPGLVQLQLPRPQKLLDEQP